jgi:hypothetical protein
MASKANAGALSKAVPPNLATFYADVAQQWSDALKAAQAEF